MAGSQRRSLSVAHESDSRLCRGSMEEIYAADGSGSRVSHAQKRTGHSPALPSAREAGEGARTGGVSRLCPVSDTEASAEARWFGILASESAEAALRVVQRGHCAANDRRAGDLVAPHH